MLLPLHRIRTARRTIRFYIAIGLALATMASQFAVLSPSVQAKVEEAIVQSVGIRIEYPLADGPTNAAWRVLCIGWFTFPCEDLIGVIVRNSASTIYVSVDPVRVSRESDATNKQIGPVATAGGP